MSKRTRTLAALGDLPYSTIEGGKWLKKALDPVDIDTEVSGLPDTATNPRVVLNYQYQDDIPIPSSNTYVPSSVQSYDADFYVYQNPVVFGMSASRPSGTKNPVGVPIYVNFDTGEVVLPSGYAPSTVRVFLNSQIEGETRNDKLNSLEKYCQRHRMIYGGVQCIPACSAMFDSGTIEATQQVFSGQNGNINDNLLVSHRSSSTEADANIYHLQSFEPNDFPDEGSSIQNATSLYCRYKEGAYMPYKIRNPLVYDYIGSEQRCLEEAPYVITSNVFYDITGLKQVNAVYNPETLTFSPPSGETFENVECIGFECYTKTGTRFYLRVWLDNVDGHVGTIVLPTKIKCYTHNITLEGHFPKADVTGGLLGVPGPHDVGSALYPVDPTNVDIFNIPVQDKNIGIICFRSVGLQASIRVIFRMGLEMMITAGGVYSPFKHKSPKYDQKAINSYIRAVHNMRDAFLGDAATPEGHSVFASHIASIVAWDGDNSALNLGSGWYGRVSV